MYVNEKMYELGSKKSAIRELFEYGKKKAKEVGAENVYDFSLGNPTVPAPDCVNETIRELTNELDSISLHGYTSAQGDEATRKAIADYLNKTYDTHFNPDNFYMTCGAAASLTITLNALVSNPEDEVIAIAPFFPEYRVFATAAGAKFVVVSADTEKFQIKFDELESKINKNTKAIIVNSPNNPSGAVYSEDTIKRLAALLEKKEKEYGTSIFIICDEPYREILKQYAENCDFLMHEAFCLYEEREIFSPYEKHHSTVKECSENAEMLNAKNLIIIHTMDNDVANRKTYYCAEADYFCKCNVIMPDDMEVIELTHNDNE